MPDTPQDQPNPPDDTESPEAARTRIAGEQGLTAPNAVPEQRPQAAQVAVPNDRSALTKKLEAAGVIDAPDSEPMGQDAYDRANSEAQAKKAEKSSKTEGPMVGSRIRALNGPHEGRIFAVTRILQDGNVADAIRRFSGDPEQLLNSPKEVEATAIGDERDGERVILNLEEYDYEKLNESFVGSRGGRLH